MSDTIREIIIKNFIARLAVITVAHGYNTGIGAKVLRARKNVDPDEIPVSVVHPGTEKGESLYGQSKCTMTMKIEALEKIVCSANEDKAEKASILSEQILGDLKKCILAPANLLTSPVTGWIRNPDYIDSIVYTEGGTNEYPDDGQVHAGAFASFEVGYTTKLNDPYSQ